MKRLSRLAGILLFGAIVLLGATPVLLADGGEPPAEEAPAVPTALADGCNPFTPASQSFDLQPREATRVSGSSGSFYVCFESDDICGGCPIGTQCAVEACGSPFNACCTGQTACVTSCSSTRCRSLCESCF